MIARDMANFVMKDYAISRTISFNPDYDINSRLCSKSQQDDSLLYYKREVMGELGDGCGRHSQICP